MRVFAYCDRRYERATRRVLGQHGNEYELLTCPPVTVGTFLPHWLEGWDAIYLDLHGEPNERYLRGEGGEWALSLSDVRDAQIGGATVFATTCYMSQTPFLRAFLRAGASAVIAGDGENYGGRWWPTGAQKLAREFLGLCPPHSAEAALQFAQEQLASYKWHRWVHRKATRDALAFRVWRGGDI